MQLKMGDESGLIAAWRNGDERAFDYLFKLHFPKLLRYTSRYIQDAELVKELAMDVMFKAWQKKQVITQEGQSLLPFLFHLNKAAIIDYFRKKSLRFLREDEINEEPEAAERADVQLNYKELNTLYRESLDLLSPQRRLVLEMNHGDGMSRREIAKALCISRHTVSRHLADAMRTVRLHLLKQGDILLLCLMALNSFYLF